MCFCDFIEEGQFGFSSRLSLRQRNLCSKFMEITKYAQKLYTKVIDQNWWIPYHLLPQTCLLIPHMKSWRCQYRSIIPNRPRHDTISMSTFDQAHLVAQASTRILMFWKRVKMRRWTLSTNDRARTAASDSAFRVSINFYESMSEEKIFKKIQKNGSHGNSHGKSL